MNGTVCLYLERCAGSSDNAGEVSQLCTYCGSYVVSAIEKKISSFF